MKWLLLFVAALIGTFAYLKTQYWSEPARLRRDTSQLIRTSGVDQLTRDGILASYRNAVRQGKLDAGQFACMGKLTVEQFNESLTGDVTRKITRADLRPTLRFYETATGKKVVRSLFLLMGKATGHESPEYRETEPEFDMEELLEFSSFRQGLKATGTPDVLQLAVDGMISESVFSLENLQRAECGLERLGG